MNVHKHAMYGKLLSGARLCCAALAVSLILLTGCQPASGGGLPEIRGRIVSAETGEPLARIPVAVVTRASLQAIPDDSAVTPQAKSVSNNLGEFRIVIPPHLGKATQVYVFTAAPLYRNRASGGVELAGQLPTKRELAAASTVSVHRKTGVSFELELAFAVNEDVRVPMRDGVELAATVVQPKDARLHPAILLRTPYGREATGDYAALAREGYVFVSQDVRGRYGSGGEALAFVDDAWGQLQDGYDTVEWIAAQEWCDGNVGTIGASALGITQNMMAGAAPPHLKAQVIIAAATSIYHDAVYVGGVLRESQVEGWLSGHDWDPENLKIAREHPYYDDYWQALDLTSRGEVAFPPAIYIGGWYDTFAEGTLRGYDLRRHNARHGAPDDTYLIMGAWTHNGMFAAASGDVALPPQAERKLIPDIISFFAHYLQGEDNRFAESSPPVQYYVMGALNESGAPGNFWMAADDFPPEGSQARMFLAPEGRLLPLLPQAREYSVELTFDPGNPVLTRGGRNLTIPAGPADQREVEKRSDVISFTTDPLTHPMPIVGLVSTQITVATEADDADISVRLSDVYPDGTSFLLLDGSARMSLPAPYEKPRRITRGKFYQVPVELGHTAYIVNAGHRLRIALAASNHPRFELNPLLVKKVTPTVLHIQLGADNPSSLQFPVCEDLLDE